MSGRKIHHAWVIMLGCCAIFGSMYVILSSGVSLFVSSICNEFNLQRAQFNLFFTGEGIAYLISSSFAGPLTKKFGIRKTYLTVALISGLSLCALSFLYTQPWQFCIGGFLCGFGVYYPLVISPIILNNWFKKSYSTALGIATAFSGIVGAVISPIITASIIKSGWQRTMRILFVVMECIVVPCILGIIRYSPESMGMSSYGSDDKTLAQIEDNEDVNPLDFRLAKKSGCYYTMFLSSFVMQFQVVLNTQAPSMMTDSGVDPVLMSTVVSIQLISLAVGKVTLGMIRDKTKSVVITALVCQISGAVGALCYLFAFLSGHHALLYAAGVFTGYGWSCVSILPSATVRAACGKKHMSSIYGPVVAGGSIMAMINSIIVGKLFDITGTHVVALIMVGGAAVLSIVFIVASVSLGGKKRMSDV